MIHLDTSFLIRALIPGTPEEAKLRMWVGKGEALVMSSVAWAEFLCGPLGSVDRELAGLRTDGEGGTGHYGSDCP